MPRVITVFHPSPASNGYNNSYDIPSSSSEDKKLLIVFAAVIVAVVMFISFYIYCCSRKSQQQTSRVAPRRTTTVTVTVTTTSTSRCGAAASVGLDTKELASLPTFVYGITSSEKESDKLECSVCLMEFKNGEKGRLLQNCGHKFHAECVDMWLSCHKTCPLCRSPVDTKPPEIK